MSWMFCILTLNLFRLSTMDGRWVWTNGFIKWVCFQNILLGLFYLALDGPFHLHSQWRAKASGSGLGISYRGGEGKRSSSLVSCYFASPHSMISKRKVESIQVASFLLPNPHHTQAIISSHMPDEVYVEGIGQQQLCLCWLPAKA